MAKRTKKDRLAALREKIENTEITRSGGGTNWFNTKDGDNTIRILPEVGDMEFPWLEVGVHYFPDKRRCYCPKILSEGELACPICELVGNLYNAGDDASVDLARKIKVSRKFWMNIIDRNDEDKGPQVYQAPPTVFGDIAVVINDPDYGDIFDEYEGVDIVINRASTGPNAWDVDYTVLPRRLSTPIAYTGDKEPDEERIDEWLEAAKELTWTILTDDPEEDDEVTEGYGLWAMPYDRIMREFLENGSDLAPELDEEDAEEEDEEVSPVQEEVTKRRARRARRRKAVS